MASDFQMDAKKWVSNSVLIIEGLLFCVGMLVLHWQAGVLAIAMACVSFGYYRFMAFREFGGITGDLAGWFLQVCELGMAVGIVIGEILWF